MFRWLLGFVLIVGFASSAAVAQAVSSHQEAQPCDNACRQTKLDALFKAMDDAEISPKPSASADCTAYGGSDLPDVLLDVCAKLKYVRSLPMGETSRFSCPRDSASLVGTPRQRIVTIWGEPDFVQSAAPSSRTTSDGEWTYFLGRAKPGSAGGGFAELTLYVVDGIVRKVDCRLAQ
jgi:hypothetical protein